MKLINLFSLFIALSVSCNSIAADKYEPGMEFDAVVPGSGVHIKLYVPSNYNSERKWPLVIFYHGVNGSPTTDCIVRHCGGKDFIVVGMSYCEKHATRLSQPQQAAYIEKERKSFRAAVGWVKNNLSLDTERVFMGGISKGGWTTSFVGEREMGNLAGMIIVLAGHQRGAVPGAQSMTGFPVYIGAGELDPNQLAGVHAVGFYRHCGANVSYEEYEGLGHQVSERAARLAQWLEAYGPQSHAWIDGAEKESRKAEYKKAYESAVALADKTQACEGLRALLHDPRLLVACGSKTRKAIAGKLNIMAKDDAATMKLLKAEQFFYDLVWKEWRMKTVDDTQVVLDGYSRLAKAASGTGYEIYAQKSYERLLPMYSSARKQMEQIKARQKSVPRKIAPRTRMRNSNGSGSTRVF